MNVSSQLLMFWPLSTEAQLSPTEGAASTLCNWFMSPLSLGLSMT